MKTVVGLFDTQAAAEEAVNALVKKGYTNDQIGVALRGETRMASASSNDPLLKDPQPASGDVGKIMSEGAVSGWNAEEYADALNYGGVVVTVVTDDEKVEEVNQTFAEHGAVDLARRQPTTVDPNKAAVKEVDAVDEPAKREITSGGLSSGGGNQAATSNATGANAPLASDSEVASQEPSGLATLEPGSEDKAEGTSGTQASVQSSATTQSPPQQPGAVRAVGGTGHPAPQQYHRSDAPYMTPDLQAEREVSGETMAAFNETGTSDLPTPCDRDLTVGEHYGGVMDENA